MTTPVNPDPQAKTATQAVAPKKTQRLGDFELVGKLGKGAMGSVYLAKQLSSNRTVALKLLPRDLAQEEEFLERFRREARAAMKLSHPNIVAAYDMGEVGNYHYIAMEFVDGPNLELILQKKGRLGQDEVLKVALDMSAALEEAEAHKIVHRDIKPANILSSNSQRLYKLTDMGLASASAGDKRVTMAGFCVGTPFYVSPEQARGDRDVDSRADIYSLGATLYHLATGRVPFEGSNPMVVMTKHLQEEPDLPHVREPAVPLHLSALIQRMMAKDPDKRQQTARELRQDIERCMRGEMPLPPSPKPKPAPRPLTPTLSPLGRGQGEGATAPAPVLAPGPPAPPLLDRIFAIADELAFFLPGPLRLPAVALVGTVVLLAMLWLATVLLKR